MSAPNAGSVTLAHKPIHPPGQAAERLCVVCSLPVIQASAYKVASPPAARRLPRCTQIGTVTPR